MQPKLLVVGLCIIGVAISAGCYLHSAAAGLMVLGITVLYLLANPIEID